MVMTYNFTSLHIVLTRSQTLWHWSVMDGDEISQRGHASLLALAAQDARIAFDRLSNEKTKANK